jgi:hypothetical protein
VFVPALPQPGARMSHGTKGLSLGSGSINKSLLLLFFRKEESSFLKERSKELLI